MAPIMSRHIAVVVFACLTATGAVGSHRCVASEDDEKLLERYSITTDGRGYAHTVFFEELKLSDQDFEQIMQAMVRLKTIKEIRFFKTPVNHRFAQELPKLQAATNLTFEGVDVGATIIRAATKLDKLESLCFFNGCRFTGDVVPEIGRCKALKFIAFVRCGELKGDLFTSFANLKHLQYLTIVSVPEVTDTGISSLRHYPALKSLNLSGTSVTDDVFAVLESVSTLTSLSVERTKVTKPRTELFKATHPNVMVHPE